ncbi:MAG: nucleotidyltransferase family protein [Clostridia bacterium]|nr:nucleotidyltransferase family protein [Clostridia bacterium]
MERINEFLIQLIGNEVCGRQIELPPDIMSDEQFVIDLFVKANEYGVAHIVASNLSRHKLLSGAAHRAYADCLYSSVFKNEKMNHIFECVCKTLDDGKIPYIPLKGTVLKKLYPEPWMRSSVDIDILVHKRDFDSASQLIKDNLGYRQGNQSDHDVTLTPDGNSLVELHFRLVEDEHKTAWTKILDDVWDYAQPAEENSLCYVLDDSFFCFYHLSHMAKHIMHGGCGIRPFLDLWLMNRKLDPAIKEKTQSLLKKGKLLKFAECAEQLSRVWFSGEAHTETTQLMENYILKGGMFGTKETRMLYNRQHHGGKRKHIFKRIFIPYKDLAYTYPIIKKYRFLTPICEICRLFSMMFGKKRKFRKAYLSDLDNVPKEYADEIRILFESVELH